MSDTVKFFDPNALIREVEERRLARYELEKSRGQAEVTAPRLPAIADLADLSMAVYACLVEHLVVDDGRESNIVVLWATEEGIGGCLMLKEEGRKVKAEADSLDGLIIELGARLESGRYAAPKRAPRAANRGGGKPK